jgi:5'(3')-deoxyribonucleotidase
LSSSSFIPQIFKIRKQGGEDLSYSMLAVYLAGALLWLVYGLMFHAPAVIWANVVASLWVATSRVLKLTWKESAGTGSGGKRRPRVAVDMDEVIADSLTRHLSLYNRATGENITPDLIREKGLEASIPPKHRGVFEQLPHEEGFFDDLGEIVNSQHALQQLSSEFDVFITSAAMEVPRSFDAKFRWLQEHFPFIPPSNIVFCGDKGIIDADYLIDDSSRHFRRFRGNGILFTAPHNARELAHPRANNRVEVLAILLKRPSALAIQQSAKSDIKTKPAEVTISDIKGVGAMNGDSERAS